MNTGKTTIQLLIKLQGFKNLKTTEFTIAADPSDTITAITTKLEKITGIYADKVSVMTGLIHGNPSGSFKKLDKNATVSDNGLRHGSTLMVFIPVVVGQQQASSSPTSPSPLQSNPLPSVAQSVSAKQPTGHLHQNPSNQATSWQ